MKKIIKKLILYYFIFVLIKSIISYIVPAPSAFSDEYIYMELARSFFYSFDFIVNNTPHIHFHPFYPIILSISYFFNKMVWIYPVMKIINSIISSLVIFPAFLLAKEVLNTKKAFLISILISLLPSNFIFSPYILAENIFYPLFLFSVYFIYKTFTSKKIIWPILMGISIGLTYLGKVNGIALFGIVIIMILYKFFKKEKIHIFHLALSFLISFLLIFPWLLRNYLVSSKVLGIYTAELSFIFIADYFIPKFIIHLILYSGLIILSSGIFLPMLISKKIFNKQTIDFAFLSLSSVLLTLIIAANHNIILPPNLSSDYPAYYLPWLAGRLIGRYTDVILPLVLILGAICIKEKISLKKTIIFSIVLFFSSQVVLSKLLPINNLSTTHLGVLNYLIQNFVSFKVGIFPINLIIIAVLLGILPFILYRLKLNFQKIFALLSIFFILLNILNFGLIYYNSNTFWYSGEQMQLGLWFDSYDPEVSTVLFDKRDCTDRILKLNQSSLCEPSGMSTIIGIWLNDDIIVKNPDNLENVDFIISRHKFDLPLIKSSKDNIYIYSTDELKK